METLYADAHLAGDFPNPANAVGNTPGTWAGELNSNANYTSRWSLTNPVDPLTAAATQTVNVVARKGSNSGTPTIALNLYEGGVLVGEILAATNVTSTTGQTLAGAFNSSQVTAGADVEIEVVQSGAGGNPSTRNSAQISLIEWVADTSPAADPVPEVTGSLDIAADFGGSLTVPPASVPQLSGTFAVEVGMGGSLTVPAATVSQVSGSFDVAVDFGGILDVPTATIAQLAGGLSVETDLGGILDPPAATVQTISGSFAVETDFGGTLQDPGTNPIPTLSATFAVETDLGGALTVPSPTVPELTGQLDIETDLGGTLDVPSASVPQLTGALATITDLSGVLAVPGGVRELTGTFAVVVGMGGRFGKRGAPGFIEGRTKAPVIEVRIRVPLVVEGTARPQTRN